MKMLECIPQTTMLGYTGTPSATKTLNKTYDYALPALGGKGSTRLAICCPRYVPKMLSFIATFIYTGALRLTTKVPKL